MAGAYLILLREGLEAALVVGVILAVLSRMGQMALARYVAMGIGAAMLCSVLFAFAAGGISDLFDGAGQEVLNGTILVLAALMITYVIVWMRRHHKQGMKAAISEEVHQRADGGGLGVFMLAFLSVFREGAESVLFLWGVSASSGESTAVVISGGLLGLATAVALAAALFKGGQRIPVKTFFNVTTVLLVFLAAGMLSRGIGYLVAVDWLPALIYTVWDTSALLSERGGLGGLLAILFGYNANPSLIEVLTYGGYLLLVVIWIRLRAINDAREAATATPTPAAGS